MASVHWLTPLVYPLVFLRGVSFDSTILELGIP